MPKQVKEKIFLIIDSNAVAHRAFHALPPLFTKSGALVNAAYGFALTLFNVIGKFNPEYIVATFDLKGPTFRHKEFSDYKATRIKAPDEFYEQIPIIKEILKAFNIPICEREGFEADDVIGTIVRKNEKDNPEIKNIIVTGDLDALQLVNNKTLVYTMKRGISEAILYGKKEVEERYGFSPEKLPDFKGLRGDASDNIPGVKGIGEKIAKDLLLEHESLEKVYAALPQIKPSLREKLERDRLQAFMSKRLGTIETNASIPFNIEKAKVRYFERKKAVKIFQDLNFYSLIRRIPQKGLEQEIDQNSNHQEVKDFKFKKLEEKEIKDFFDIAGENDEVAIKLDIENQSSNNTKILGIALSYKTGRASYIDFSKRNIPKIKKILENERIRKVGYNLKNDIRIFKKAGIELSGVYFDVMLGAYVLNPGSNIEFAKLVLEYLGEEIGLENKKGQLELEIKKADSKEVSCAAADYILKLKGIFEKKIAEISLNQKKDANLKKVFESLEMPVVGILAQMEESGIRFNPIIFKGISEKIEKRIQNLEKSIYDLAGKGFNINSPKQLAEILFSKLKIPTAEVKKLKTGFSTASAELQKIKKEHAIIEKIEKYRELFKLKTTYLDTLPMLVDKNSRIHTNFNQAVTTTGRLSSSDPNLQNIPTKTDLGQLLRTAFEAEKGYNFISADYSQIDLRAVAHVSNDTRMIESFLKGEDIHSTTAAEINKVTPSKVTDKMRRSAKALNFGVIYGMSVFGFSQSAGIERDEAKKFIGEYMKRFSGVAQYMRETKEFAKKKGYVETQMGRRRYIPEINSPNFQVQNAAERMAINMPIQGLAADIMKLAMIEVYRNVVKKYNSDNPESIRMVLQIHDEIILEVKENLSKEVTREIKEVMEKVYKLKVPLAVNIKIGDNWGEI